MQYFHIYFEFICLVDGETLNFEWNLLIGWEPEVQFCDTHAFFWSSISSYCGGKKQDGRLIHF